MSRWHRRLAELRGNGSKPSTTSTTTVQNAQNVQNSPPAPSFEHFDRFEHDTVSPSDPPAAEATSAAAGRVAGTRGEAEVERAAIVQFEGGIPREWAEGFARLNPDRPPDDVPLRRWRQFIDDVGHFLDSPFCEAAAALGWRPHDLFACDRDRTFSRGDQAGLLWLLNGDKLVMLAENAATIETPDGERHTFWRRPAAAGGVLAWEAAS